MVFSIYRSFYNIPPSNPINKQLTALLMSKCFKVIPYERNSEKINKFFKELFFNNRYFENFYYFSHMVL